MIGSLFNPKWQARYNSLPILGGIWPAFCEWLRQKGYSDTAIRRRVYGGPLLEDALQSRGVRSLCELTASQLRSLAPAPSYWTPQLTCALISSLLSYLAERGELATSPPTQRDMVIASFRQHLESVRGLTSSTAARTSARAAQFLQFLDHDATPGRLQELTMVEVDAFVAKLGLSLGRASMQKVVAVLRAFLRFSAAEGLVPVGLDSQIDSPRCLRGELLPRALPWSSVRILIQAIDRTTPKGLRDYAMLLLIATYGLRVGEVAALTLDHIAWRTRQFLLPRPKVGTLLPLPLTDDVASALADYLRNGRQASVHRHLFLRVRTPGSPVKSTTICDAFDCWAARSGIQLPPKGSGGPHCLRHSLAVHLLRTGVTLKAIGDLLGHRSAESTGVYLRLQLEDLRDVCLSLPGAGEVEL